MKDNPRGYHREKLIGNSECGSVSSACSMNLGNIQKHFAIRVHKILRENLR